MSTASTHQTITGRLRMLALAGTLALGAMVPVVPGALASGDTAPVTAVTVEDSTSAFDIDPSAGLIGLEAEVAGGGDGVNLRADAAHDADVLDTVPDGTVVQLRVDQVDTVYDADGVTRWWPVAVGGTNGWMSGAFLADVGAETAPAAAPAAVDADSAAPATTSVPAREPFDFDFTGPEVAEISADGDGLVLRAEPSRESTEVTSIPDGTVVDLRIDMLDTVYDEQGTRWWPVAYDGMEGWVSGFYLVTPGATQQAAAAADASEAPVADAVFGAGDTVKVVTPTGSGLVVRADPSPEGERLTSLHEQQEVTIVEGPASNEGSENGWYLISTGDVTGYVDGDLLELVSRAVVETPVPTEAPQATEPPAEADTDTDDAAGLAAGTWAVIGTPNGNGVQLRAGASANTDQSGFAPNQGLVEILSGPENGWYEVRWDTQSGWIDGAVLTPSDAPQTAPSTTLDQTNEDADVAEPAESVATVAALQVGDRVQVDAGSSVGINVREDASQDSGRVGFLDQGAEIQITDGPEADDDGSDWYRMTDGQQDGWVRGDLLERVAADDGDDDSAEASAAVDATSGFGLPMENFRFTQDYGCSSLGFYAYNAQLGCSIHDGVDLAAASGTPINAVQDGEVVAAGWCDCGLGYYVEIDHGDGLHTIYGHMASQPYVAVGQQVTRGEVIGPVGSTGLSTGPHVHFMVQQDGTTQDPKNYLPPLN